MKSDPLDSLLLIDEAFEVPVIDRAHAAEVQRNLAALSASMAAPDPRGRGRGPGLGALSLYSHPLRLNDDLRELVETAVRAVWEAKLDGKAHVEAGLMRQLAFTASPKSIRFFEDAIAFTGPRDKLIPQRQQWAVADLRCAYADRGWTRRVRRSSAF